MSSGPLNRSLGLPMLTFYGTGMIVGAGIYSVLGKAADKSGDTLWLGFIIAGLAALLTAFAYAELSSMFPKAGAEFVYLSEAFKKQKWIAGTIGIAIAFSGAATSATVAIAFTGYLNQFTQVPQALTAVILLLILTGIAIFGIRASGWTNIIFTLIEVGGLGLIIYLGITSEKFAQSLAMIPHNGTLAGAALIVFSYFGFENIVNLAEEAKEPEKKVPQAIFLSLAISTLLYVLVSLAALALLPPSELAKSNAALMTAAQKSSQNFATILGGAALFSTANTALLSLIGASRILYGMSSAKALPKAVSYTLSKRKTPWIASLVVMTAALMLLPLGKVEVVAGVSSLATMIAFVSVNVAVVALRITDEKRKRPFKTPFSLGRWPMIPILGAVVSLVFVFQFEGVVYAVGGGLILVTAIAFLIAERMK